MKKNIGATDRIIRVILGLVILLLGFFYQSWWGLIGLIPLATGVVGWCGLYTALGITTAKNKAEK